MVYGDLTAAKISGALLEERSVRDEVGQPNEREGRWARRRRNGLGGGDVKVNTPHTTARSIGITDGAVRLGGESVLQGELDGGGAGELVPERREEGGGEGRVIARRDVEAVEIN